MKTCDYCGAAATTERDLGLHLEWSCDACKDHRVTVVPFVSEKAEGPPSGIPLAVPSNFLFKLHKV